MYRKSNIESLLRNLDNKTNEKVEVIAIGGTALSLTGVKRGSKDVDLCYGDCKSSSDFAQSIIDSGIEAGIDPAHIEMFHGFEMSILDIPDFEKRSIPYEGLSLKHIVFKTMHPADIILSKIHRGEARDFEDIKDILDSGIITSVELKSRFIEIAKHQQDFEVRRDFMRKYESFIKTTH